MIKKHVLWIMLTVAFLIFSNDSYATIEDIENHWCEKEIDSMYRSEYIDCRDENNFRPDEALTKAEFCMTVNKVLDYCDIETSNPNWKEEHFAVGIEKGYMPIGSVDDTITREEACVIFERISDITIDNAIQAKLYESFYDYDQVSIWADKSVKRMVINGKIIGYTDNTLKMKNKLTRAEFVMIMTRFDETIKQIESIDAERIISLNTESRLKNIDILNNIKFLSNVQNTLVINNINYIIPKKIYII